MILQNEFFKIEITEIAGERPHYINGKPYDLSIELDYYSKYGDFYKTISISIMDFSSSKLSTVSIAGDIYISLEEANMVLSETKLIILIIDTVLLIDLKTTILVRKNNVMNMSTAFAIYPFLDSYVIHGELEIVLISQECERIWGFSARDIFVTASTKNSSDDFQIKGEYIICHDWQGYTYKLDKFGKEVAVG